MKYRIRNTTRIPPALFERRVLRELRLLNGYLEHLTSTLIDGFDPATESKFLPAVYEVHCLAGIAGEELDLVLAGSDELPGLEACLKTAKGCLYAARSLEPDETFRELGESMRLLGLCSVSLVCVALGDVERRAGQEPSPLARNLPGVRPAMLAAV